MNYNKIILAGNLVKDPELKLVNSTNLCKFTLAVNKLFKNKKTGQMDKDTCFIDVALWGYNAENIGKHLSKGANVLVEGELRQESYQVNGENRTKHTITADIVKFLVPKKEEGPTQENKKEDDIFNDLPF